MLKKALLSAIIIIVFLSIASVYIKAQDSQEFDIEKSFNQISLRQESINKEIQAKLDKILVNQQTILQELAIVKVRATRK